MPDTFTQAYIVAALWSSTDENDVPLDSNYIPADISPETFKRMVADCASFQEQAGDLLDSYDLERAGHDFWFTRNRHGSGYWDGDYAEPEATKLTDLAHGFGECDLYVGDDEMIYA
jgi:hypothetical protein